MVTLKTLTSRKQPLIKHHPKIYSAKYQLRNMSDPVLWKLTHDLCVGSHVIMAGANLIVMAATRIGNGDFENARYISWATFGAAIVVG